MKKEYCVYVHTNKVTGKRYVGMASNPVKRWGKDGLGYSSNHEFHADILKYGWDGFSHEIIAVNLSRKEAEEKERFLIQKYDSANPSHGYNKGLGGIFGKKASAETKQKISEAGRRRFAKPEEHEKLSRAAIRRNQDPVKFANICEGNRRRWQDKKEHEKITNSLNAYYKANPDRRSEISKERKRFFKEHPEKKTTKRVYQLSLNGRFLNEWNSMTEAANFYQIDIRNISAVCKGKRKSAGGYSWQLVEG